MQFYNVICVSYGIYSISIQCMNLKLMFWYFKYGSPSKIGLSLWGHNSRQSGIWCAYIGGICAYVYQI